MELDSVLECLEFNKKDKVNKGRVIGVNTYKLARVIMKEVPVATVLETKDVLTYFHGKYIPNGAEFIHKLCVEALKEFVKTDGSSVYTEHVYREVLGIIRGLTYTRVSKFDDNLDIINLQNGLLNWRTGEFSEHTPAYKSRIQLPIYYDPDAECPSIEKIFKTVLSEEDYIKGLEFVAYCLYRSYPIQKIFIMYGPGGTGKSKFLDIILSFLGGDNCSSVSMHDIENDRFATSDLYGKMLNGFGDMEQSALKNVNKLKMATSNSDMLRAQKKGERAFDFLNYAKFIFGTNKLAYIFDDTTGFYRRIELLPFMHVFTPEEYDPVLLANAKSPEELSGLLNLVIPYLGPLLERKDFTNPYDSETARIDYCAASDPMRTFIEMFLEDSAEHVAPKDEVYQAYDRFCKKYNVNAINSIWFGRMFSKALGPKLKDSIRSINGKSKTVWLCYRLKPDFEVYENVPI